MTAEVKHSICYKDEKLTYIPLFTNEAYNYSSRTRAAILRKKCFIFYFDIFMSV